MNQKLVEEIKNMKEFKVPAWACFVKTGVSKERVPENKDWFYVRAASILLKFLKYSPIGVKNLSKMYGGRQNRGYKPDKRKIGARNHIRKILQNFVKLKLIKQVEKPKAGKILTKEGKEFLKKFNN